MEKFMGIGEIATKLGENRDRIAYIVRTSSIRPDMIAAGRKSYSVATVATIKKELGDLRDYKFKGRGNSGT